MRTNKTNDKKVIPLVSRSKRDELQRLQRLTGLSFSEFPVSLLAEELAVVLPVDDGAELIHRALHLWEDEESPKETRQK